LPKSPSWKVRLVQEPLDSELSLPPVFTRVRTVCMSVRDMHHAPFVGEF